MLQTVTNRLVTVTINVDNLTLVNGCNEKSNLNECKHLMHYIDFAKDCIKKKLVVVQYVPRVHQVADVLTKVSTKAELNKFCEDINLCTMEGVFDDIVNKRAERFHCH